MNEGSTPHLSDARLPLIVFAGNVGAGKTTLARALSAELSLPLVLESVEDNPFLNRFYSNMQRWTFHLNMYFLASRAAQLRSAARGGVIDRSLLEDRIFVQLSLDGGNNTIENVAVFNSLLDTLVDLLPKPDVLVYLSASPTTLHERVRTRGRAFEQSVTLEYLEVLAERYEQWISTYDQSPVITLDTDGDSGTDRLTAQLLKDLQMQGHVQQL